MNIDVIICVAAISVIAIALIIDNKNKPNKNPKPTKQEISFDLENVDQSSAKKIYNSEFSSCDLEFKPYQNGERYKAITDDVILGDVPLKYISLIKKHTITLGNGFADKKLNNEGKIEYIIEAMFTIYF